MTKFIQQHLNANMTAIGKKVGRSISKHPSPVAWATAFAHYEFASINTIINVSYSQLFASSKTVILSN